MLLTLDSPELDAYARDVAARAGNLDHLRTRTQLEAHDKWQSTSEMVYLVDCSRRWGKTWDACFKVFEVMAYAPRRFGRPGIVRYCAPTKLAGRQFVMPVFDAVAKMVPEDCRPRFDRQDVCWRWPNGGVCYLGSAETMGDAEAQVGTSCDLAICDEAGKYPMGILSHLIKSVYGWQFAATGFEHGRIYIPSTPPLTPAHDLKAVRDRCFLSGNYSRYTIEDCDHITPEQREKIVRQIFEEEGGETAVRREAYCEYVTDETMAVIPEMRGADEWITRDCEERPQFFDCYVVGDFGFSDLTVVLFAYYDFARAVLVIEDELVFRGKSGIEVARGVMQKRHELWGIHKEPRCQLADVDPQVIADMAESTRHDIIGGQRATCVFGNVEKTDKDAALNTARRMVSERRVRIHPRCKVTLDHMHNAVWANGRKTTFDRSDMYGHFDAVDAFKYLVRHVDWRRNPVPVLHGLDPQTHHIPDHMSRAAAAQQTRASLANLVARKRRV